jgi:DNA-directed RNA polymerase specialized sigma subunit
MDIFSEKNGSLSIKIERVSKAAIQEIAQSVVSYVLNGNDDPLKEYIKAKALSDIASEISEGLKDDAIKEAEKYDLNDPVFGCKVVLKSTPTSYDFSHDGEWRSVNQEMEKLKLRLKEREKKMIDAMKYSELSDEFGEVIPPALVKKEGSQTIAINIPK